MPLFSKKTRHRERVIYQIYVQSFNDSNGDGIGDIKGIIEKLPYLNQLGIDIIWLTPIFCSPFEDNGYDVSDYKNLNPIFGTKGDLKELIEKAKNCGIELMLDMVLNHCSIDHDWFKRAKFDSHYRDYFKIYDKAVVDKLPITSKFGGSAWEYFDNQKGKDYYYLHLFSKGQADFNWDNSYLRQEMFDIINYWVNFGIKHYRLDVINLISKKNLLLYKSVEGTGKELYTDGPNSHGFISELFENSFGKIPDGFSVGELSSSTIHEAAKYSNRRNQQLDSVFCFNYLKFDFKNNERWVYEKPDLNKFWAIIKKWQEGMQRESGWLGIALNNHDQPRFYSRFFGHKEIHWSNQHKLLAMLLFTLRGTPFIYQGDEYGEINPHFKSYKEYRDVESINYYNKMIKKKAKDEVIKDLERFSRDNGRTPMRWDPSKNNYGFSEKTPWIPTSNRELPSFLLEQIQKPNSIFNFYRYMIKFWKANPILRSGKISFLDSKHKHIVSYVRRHKLAKWTTHLNFSDKTITIKVKKDDKIILTNYITGKLQDGYLTLRPYEGVIIRNA